MEFLSKYDGVPPKNLFPCLATITIGDPRPARRMSGGSFSGKSDDGADDGGNALKRVISGGGRRKSSFGAAASAGQTAEERRASLAPGNDHNAKGTWYWRVQAGVTDVSCLRFCLQIASLIAASLSWCCCHCRSHPTRS